MVLKMGVFHRISSCMEKPESHQIEGLDSAADAGETPASAVTHGVRAPGFDSLFKTSLARRGVGIAAGIAQLGRGGNQKAEDQHLLLCRIARS